MSSTFIRSPNVAKAAARQLPRQSGRPLQSARRSYATAGGRPSSSGSPPQSRAHNHNQTVMIGLTAIALPTMLWYTMSSPTPTQSHFSSNSNENGSGGGVSKPSPQRDPTEANHMKSDSNVVLHPEHTDPELKPAFGVRHKAKRVDGPPDERNHQALHDRNKSI